ncbi:hypothetical protein J6590_034201 [Homalodisca vitripennis]|nr:hypothetical protein J6590_034201 [Homalodisca vitripennis]
MAPKNLTIEPKDNLKNACLDLLDSIENDPNFSVTNVPETKRQSEEWHSPISSTSSLEQIKIKTMLICFLIAGDHSQRICAYRTIQVLERLWKMVLRVRTDTSDSSMLHHDNATCHTATTTCLTIIKFSLGNSETHLLRRMNKSYSDNTRADCTSNPLVWKMIRVGEWGGDLDGQIRHARSP